MLILKNHVYNPLNTEAKEDLRLNGNGRNDTPEWSKINVEVSTTRNHIQIFLVSSLSDSANPTLALPFNSQRLIIIRPTLSDTESRPLTLPMNPPASAASLSDLTTLQHLHAPSLISSLSYRFDHSLIYTLAGTGITISINPCKLLPSVYAPAQISHYHALSRAADQQEYQESTPHVYKVSSGAAFALQTTKKDQAILVSGESGSGKTVATRYLLKYLSQVTKSKKEPSKIQDRVISSNPILESFGNALTLRNPNSSRFGKFITLTFQIGFDKLKMEHGVINTYLLEKSRILYQAPGERNYHVFYQLLKNKKSYKDLFLSSTDHEAFCSSFNLLKDSSMPPPSEFTDLSITLEAFATMGFTPEQVAGVLHTVSTCLHLGNLTFDTSSDVVTLPETPLSKHVCTLLGVKMDSIKHALTTRTITTGSETYEKPLDHEACEKARDALVKALYSGLFTDIVHQINKFINADDENSAAISSTRGDISILDIFGFETFSTNSLEQLCINYCNEILQSQFNSFVFSNEQRLYDKEGIKWSHIAWSDNNNAINVVTGKNSVLEILDEQVMLGKTDDMAFVTKVYDKAPAAHPKAFAVTNKNKADGEFQVQHYAGWVTYNCQDFLEKNKDELPRESADLLQSSEVHSIKSLSAWIQAAQGTNKIARNRASSVNAIKSVSTTSQFTMQLAKLMERINATQPHYIRCIKPNDALAPDVFHDAMVGDQLRCAGVLEAVRVSRLGYPHRYEHSDFFNRYKIVTEKEKKKSKQAKDRCFHVVTGVIKGDLVRRATIRKDQEAEFANLDESKLKIGDLSALYGMQVGKTKVFLQRQAFEDLEQARTKQLHVVAIRIQSTYRSFLARLKFGQNTIRAKRQEEEKMRKAVEEAMKAKRDAEAEAQRVEELENIKAEAKASEEARKEAEEKAAAATAAAEEAAKAFELKATAAAETMRKNLQEHFKREQDKALKAARNDAETSLKQARSKMEQEKDALSKVAAADLAKALEAAEKDKVAAAKKVAEEAAEEAAEDVRKLKKVHDRLMEAAEEKAEVQRVKYEKELAEMANITAAKAEALLAEQSDQSEAARKAAEDAAEARRQLQDEHGRALKAVHEASESMRIKFEKEKKKASEEASEKAAEERRKLKKAHDKAMEVAEEEAEAMRISLEKEKFDMAKKAAEETETLRVMLEKEKIDHTEHEAAARKNAEEATEAKRQLQEEHDRAMKAVHDASEKMKIKFEKENESLLEREQKKAEDAVKGISEEMSRKIEAEKESRGKLEKEQARALIEALKSAKDEAEKTRIRLENEKNIALRREQEKAKKATEEVISAMRSLEIGQVEAIDAARLKLEQEKKEKRAVEDELTSLRHKIEEDKLARRIEDLEKEQTAKKVFQADIASAVLAEQEKASRASAATEDARAKLEAEKEAALSELADTKKQFGELQRLLKEEQVARRSLELAAVKNIAAYQEEQEAKRAVEAKAEKTKMTMKAAAEAVRVKLHEEKEATKRALEAELEDARRVAQEEKENSQRLAQALEEEHRRKLEEEKEVSRKFILARKNSMEATKQTMQQEAEVIRLRLEEEKEMRRQLEEESERSKQMTAAEADAMRAKTEYLKKYFIASSGQSPLHVAVAANDESAVEMMLSHQVPVELLKVLRSPIDVNGVNREGRTALHVSMANHNAKMVKLLLGKDADVNAQDNAGDSAIHLADDKTMVEMLLEAHGSANLANDLGFSPLHLAVKRQDLEIAELLLAAGAEVNSPCETRGQGPLHLVAKTGQADMLRLLCEKLENGMSMSPERTASLKVARGARSFADLNAKDTEGNTPLHYLVSGNHGDLMEQVMVMLQSGAEVNAQNCKGLSPMHLICQNLAARRKMLGCSVLRILLEYGGNCNVKGNDNCTPLHYALYYKGHESHEMALILVEAGGSMTAKWNFPGGWARWWENASSPQSSFSSVSNLSSSSFEGGSDVVLCFDIIKSDAAATRKLLGGIIKPQGWVPNDDHKSCMQCDKGFSLVQRRHHCRNCGRCVCGSCAPEQISVDLLPEAIAGTLPRGLPARVCFVCEDVLTSKVGIVGGGISIKSHSRQPAASDVTFDTFVGSSDGRGASFGGVGGEKEELGIGRFPDPVNSVR
jgi:myosin-5